MEGESVMLPRQSNLSICACGGLLLLAVFPGRSSLRKAAGSCGALSGM